MIESERALKRGMEMVLSPLKSEKRRGGGGAERRWRRRFSLHVVVEARARRRYKAEAEFKGKTRRAALAGRNESRNPKEHRNLKISI